MRAATGACFCTCRNRKRQTYGPPRCALPPAPAFVPAATGSGRRTARPAARCHRRLLLYLPQPEAADVRPAPLRAATGACFCTCRNRKRQTYGPPRCALPPAPAFVPAATSKDKAAAVLAGAPHSGILLPDSPRTRRPILAGGSAAVMALEPVLELLVGQERFEILPEVGGIYQRGI